MEKAYSAVAENLKRIRHEIGEAMEIYGRESGSVRLMAVTKTVPPDVVNEAVTLGIDLLGENRAQELLTKYDVYNKKAEIHFIGHLQSNKVRQIIDKVSMIQSVDRMSLAREISAQAAKISRTTDILVEVNIGGEVSKSGVNPEKLEDLLREIALLPFVKIKGLMAIPPFSGNILQMERYFYDIRQLNVDISTKNIDNVCMDILSMGMSGDYVPAIKHGSNIVRIGSAIFGLRG